MRALPSVSRWAESFVEPEPEAEYQEPAGAPRNVTPTEPPLRERLEEKRRSEAMLARRSIRMAWAYLGWSVGLFALSWLPHGLGTWCWWGAVITGAISVTSWRTYMRHRLGVRFFS